MIPVEEAQARLLALSAPLPVVTLPLNEAIGRYLASDLIAGRSQPAADLSAMDGYAIRFADLPGPFRCIGESAAGRPFAGTVAVSEAVRIFTGAHVPDGADTILVQEDAEVAEGEIRLVGDGPNCTAKHVRHAGGDFRSGEVLLWDGTRLKAGSIAAAAMGGHGSVRVGRLPKVKIIATGDELLPPGAACDAAHIPSSNNIMLQAMLATLPCEPVDAGIVGDDLAKLAAAFENASAYDIVVTSGGASVGDHDFVRQALLHSGAEIDFWRVAMRPGKPLMAGRIGNTVVLGLPGNPGSAFVTAFLFLLPLVRHLAGSKAPLPEQKFTTVADDLPGGDKRATYIRAQLAGGLLRPFDRQDSGMISPLVSADALIFRPPFAPPVKAGGIVPYFAL